MMKNKKLELVQGIEPNTAEGKNMQYAAVWNEKGTFIVQIGMEPVRVLEAMKNVEFSHIFKTLVVNSSTKVFALDRNLGNVIGSTENVLGERALTIGIDLADAKYDEVSEQVIQGEKCYVVFYAINDIVLVYAITENDVITPVRQNTMVQAIYCLLVAALAIVLILWFINRDIIRGIQSINENLRHITQGDLHAKIGENSVPELNDMGKHINEMIDSLMEIANTQHQLELARAEEKAKEEFLSRMSHDIRTPMNGIMGFLHMLHQNINNKQVAEDLFNKLDLCGSQLQLLVNDVLEMSRLQNGKVTLFHEPFDISVSLKTCMFSLRGLADEHHVELSVQEEDITHANVVGSDVHVQRIMMNIISNAIKYSDGQDGMVQVSLHEQPVDEERSIYELVVSDNGIGMSKEFLQRIFQPFEREDTNSDNYYKGTGLGMAITKELVDLMHGTIAIDSTEGIGTTVTVHIPLEINSVDNAQLSPQTEENEKSLKGRHFLLAEDNALNSKIAVYLLNEEGAEVVAVKNGKEAVQTFSEAPEGTFDMILMDIRMPEMNGYEATSAIRKLPNPDAATIPILAMSANAFAEDIAKCKECGMNDHIPKPLNIEQMKRTLKKYL